MMHRSKIISYLKLGYLLHLMTLLEIILLTILFQTFQINSWLENGNLFFKVILVIPFAILPFFAQFDAYSRYQNYKQLKDHLFIHGFERRIVKPFVKSRCQRDAAFVAAEELGMKKECRKYFYDLGYKWHHFLPDFLSTKPQTLICKSFWLNTFFAKHYKPRFDFKKVNPIADREINQIVFKQFTV